MIRTLVTALQCLFLCAFLILPYAHPANFRGRFFVFEKTGKQCPFKNQPLAALETGMRGGLLHVFTWRSICSRCLWQLLLFCGNNSFFYGLAYALHFWGSAPQTAPKGLRSRLPARSAPYCVPLAHGALWTPYGRGFTPANSHLLPRELLSSLLPSKKAPPVFHERGKTC